MEMFHLGVSDIGEINDSVIFLCGYPQFLLQCLNCIPELSQNYNHLWVVVKFCCVVFHFGGGQGMSGGNKGTKENSLMSKVFNLSFCSTWKSTILLLSPASRLPGHLPVVSSAGESHTTGRRCAPWWKIRQVLSIPLSWLNKSFGLGHGLFNKIFYCLGSKCLCLLPRTCGLCFLLHGFKQAFLACLTHCKARRA